MCVRERDRLCVIHYGRHTTRACTAKCGTSCSVLFDPCYTHCKEARLNTCDRRLHHTSHRHKNYSKTSYRNCWRLFTPFNRQLSVIWFAYYAYGTIFGRSFHRFREVMQSLESLLAIANFGSLSFQHIRHLQRVASGEIYIYRVPICVFLGRPLTPSANIWSNGLIYAPTRNAV